MEPSQIKDLMTQGAQAKQRLGASTEPNQTKILGDSIEPKKI